MKKPIIYFGVLLLTLSVAWVSCTNSQNGEGNKESDSIPSDTSYLVLSQLAFQAYLFDSAATIKEIQALYMVAQDDSRELAKHLAGTSKDDTFIERSPSVKPTVASIFPVTNMLASVRTSGKVDLCPCPNSTELCPCPGISATILFATRTNEVKVTAGAEDLTPKPITGSSEAGWKAFGLTDLSDRSFTLTIKANFTGSGEVTYHIPMVIDGGKLYVDKWTK